MAELRLPVPRAYRIGRQPVPMAHDGDPPEGRRSVPPLDRAIRADVVRPLIADRSEAYFAILAVLLAATREGEEALPLDELRRRVRLADEDDAAFLRDLLQLEAWGCLRRELEPARVRGYSDARRDRYRHRLTEDAAALVAWLEARALERERVHLPDARERLADVRARMIELRAIVGTEEHDEEAARRGVYLVRSIDGELAAIERSLAQLDAELRTFARRSFDPDSLERIVRGLEAFLGEHVAPVQPGRAALAAAVEDLEQAGLGSRWSAWAAEKQAWPASASGSERERDGVLEAWRAHLAPDGGLDRLARRVETSTRAAIAALRAHVRRAVEESVAPRQGLDRALRLLATREEEHARLALWGAGMPTWAPGPGGPLAPPLPRRRVRAAPLEPIGVERPTPAAIARYTPEARRLGAAEWIERAWSDADPSRSAPGSTCLSALHPSVRRDESSPAAWMTIAKARHLGRGLALARWGLRVEPRPGVVTLGDETRGLVAPDCTLRRASVVSKGGAR
ncbi:MAG: DUF2397 family protein [Sandaracinus sp.]